MTINWWTYQGYRWWRWSATRAWACGRASCARLRSSWWIRGRGGIMQWLGRWDCRRNKWGRGRLGSVSRLFGCWGCRLYSRRRSTSLVILNSSIRRPSEWKSSSRCFLRVWCLKPSCPPNSSLSNNQRLCRNIQECCKDPPQTRRPRFPSWLWSCRGWSKWGSCYCWHQGQQWCWAMQFWVRSSGWGGRTCSAGEYLFGSCQPLLWSDPPSLASSPFSMYPTSAALLLCAPSGRPCSGLASRWIDIYVAVWARGGGKAGVCLN